MFDESIRYLLVILGAITSVLLSLLIWNIKSFLDAFKDHIVKDDHFADGMLNLTATIVESNRQIDMRLQRIENKLWN